MSDLKHPDATTIRAEVNALFGIRWDTLVEWVVISWLSIWFWTSPIWNMTEPPSWAGGPLSGLEDFFGSLGMAPPEWLSGSIVWVVDPARAWLAAPLLVISVVTCVSAVRSRSFSGLRTVALVSAAIACEIEGSLAPVAWILMLAAVPAAYACALAFIRGHRRDPEDEPRHYYFWPSIVTDYLTDILFLFIAPVFAPLLLAAQLVISFRSKALFDPAEELAREVLHAYDPRTGSSAEAHDELTALAANASIALAGNPAPEARRIAASLYYRLRKRRHDAAREAARKLANGESFHRLPAGRGL
ncbi:hypothetical protein ACFY9N_00865 [Microbacterium sp. NPDC008134]|uniref:hypothetical protein n=1 Tax=Microbacterium sp. NPDC008134 TaxID=3364183 RepID=UPI0036E3AFB1